MQKQEDANGSNGRTVRKAYILCSISRSGDFFDNEEKIKRFASFPDFYVYNIDIGDINMNPKAVIIRLKD